MRSTDEEVKEGHALSPRNEDSNHPFVDVIDVGGTTENATPHDGNPSEVDRSLAQNARHRQDVRRNVMLEQIEDNIGPVDVTQSFELSKIDFVETIDNEGAPQPFNSAEFEDDSFPKKEEAKVSQAEEPIIETERELGPNASDEEVDESDIQNINDGGIEQSQPSIHILEAWPVSSERHLAEAPGITIIAEPIPPWWKQRRTKILLIFVIVVVTASVIAVGVSLSSKRPIKEVRVNITQSTPFPSFSQTPTASLAPSSSPTTCVDKISTSVQKIDLETEIDNPLDPQVAIDGENMAIVVRDSRFDYAKIIFYTLKDRKWDKIMALSEDYSWDSDNSVVMSGTTALAGFPRANRTNGLVMIYEQNIYGLWEKTEPLLPSVEQDGDSHYGWAMDIDGDLACVGGWYDTFIFVRNRQSSNKWIEKNRLAGGIQCRVSGNTIAVNSWGDILLYEYNNEWAWAGPIQDPIDCYSGSIDLDRHFLAVTTPSSVIIHRRGLNNTFTESQQLTSSDYNLDDTIDPDHQFAMDKGIMVVGGFNNTYFYSEHNGQWQEIFRVNDPFDQHKISDRNIILASWKDVYYYNIEACTVAMPTQTPSFSMAPTSCHKVTIVIVYRDDHALDISWRLQRIEKNGDKVTVETFYENDSDATSYSGSVCLQNGIYEFSIYSKWGKGLCCEDGRGYYNVTTSSGSSIANGGEFSYHETTRITLPE